MQNYVVPCSSAFRDAVLDLARYRNQGLSELALGLLSVLPLSSIQRFPDPGEPGPKDREPVMTDDGTDRARRPVRKPRLLARLPDGLSFPLIRRTFGLLLAVHEGRFVIDARPVVADPVITDPAGGDPIRAEGAPPLRAAGDTVPADLAEARQAVLRAEDEADRARAAALIARRDADEMRASVAFLAFQPLEGPIVSVDQARYILGFPPGTQPSRAEIKTRFRQLTQIYHPDRPTGDTTRMTQLIDAARYLELQAALGVV